MAKFKRVVVAGPLVVECVYPAPNPRDSVGVRQGKKALSSEAQRRMNLKYAWQKLELEIAANFGPGDIYATLTYDDGHLPQSRKECAAHISAFVRKLRAQRKELGQELRYIYVIEHRHGDGRWHAHILLNSTGQDYSVVQQAWGRGRVEFKAIRLDRDKNYESLARYLCKEQRDKVGQRLWSGSRNLRKPEKECFRVPNDTPLKPPDNAAILFEDTGDVVTAYGHYRYIKYLAAGGAPAAPRPKRRRRKKRT